MYCSDPGVSTYAHRRDLPSAPGEWRRDSHAPKCAKSWLKGRESAQFFLQKMDPNPVEEETCFLQWDEMFNQGEMMIIRYNEDPVAKLSLWRVFDCQKLSFTQSMPQSHVFRGPRPSPTHHLSCCTLRIATLGRLLSPYCGYIWGFPKMVIPNNHGFSYSKWSFWGVLRVRPFKETPIILVQSLSTGYPSQNTNVYNYMFATVLAFLVSWAWKNTTGPRLEYFYSKLSGT